MHLKMPRLRAYKSVDSLEQKLLYASFSKRLIDNRSQFQIAVIDDEPFTPLESLRRNNYNITYLQDISAIDTLRRFSIVLCDLIGVGGALNPTLQGAHIIVETKKSFPEKIIVAYTGGGRQELLQPSIQAADYFLPKDANVEKWTDVLDAAIQDLANPATVWRKFRHRLLDTGVTPFQLAELEDIFVSKISRGEEFSLSALNEETTRLRIPSPARAILEHVVLHIGFDLAKEFIRSAQ
jgi:hypothetical protein